MTSHIKPLRIIDPPLDELSKLRTHLNAAEEQVLEFFNRLLPPAWEIYIQPHLNGLEPDFVLLNPKVGVAVFEVKGWNFDRREFQIKRNKSGAPILMSRNKGEPNFYRVVDNPIDKIYLYKQELSELYLARVEGANAYRVITAGVILPFADDDQIQKLFEPFRQRYRMHEWPNYYPLVGRESIETNNLRAVFPEANRSSSRYMNEAAAQDLRSWLIEPDHSKTQREKIQLNEKQEELATTRTATGYRRIKGPAGSGKSLVLAARAGELATAQDKKVLVVSYNITLLHYLRDLAVRWPEPGECRIKNITFLNFHAWCKRVCKETGHLGEYEALFRLSSEDERDDILDRKLPNLVARILDKDAEHHATYYDAVLVDEGQDYRQEWWSLLRKICRPEGEMILAADTTQDIYKRTQHWSAGAWTDQPMEGAGFRGPWAQLEATYRMPVELTRIANKFARSYLPNKLNILSEEAILPLIPDYSDHPCRLRWIQTDGQSAVTVCFDEIIDLIKTATPESVGITDIVFLAPDTYFGEKLARCLTDKHYSILHTFAENERDRRRQKHAFFMGAAKIKGTTIHSFKGWETRALLVYTGDENTQQAMPLLYTAMTRLKRHQKGSFLTVISAVPTLADFGSTWPEYEKTIHSLRVAPISP